MGVDTRRARWILLLILITSHTVAGILPLFSSIVIGTDERYQYFSVVDKFLILGFGLLYSIILFSLLLDLPTESYRNPRTSFFCNLYTCYFLGLANTCLISSLSPTPNATSSPQLSLTANICLSFLALADTRQILFEESAKSSTDYYRIRVFMFSLYAICYTLPLLDLVDAGSVELATTIFNPSFLGLCALQILFMTLATWIIFRQPTTMDHHDVTHNPNDQFAVSRYSKHVLRVLNYGLGICLLYYQEKNKSPWAIAFFVNLSQVVLGLLVVLGRDNDYFGMYGSCLQTALGLAMASTSGWKWPKFATAFAIYFPLIAWRDYVLSRLNR